MTELNTQETRAAYFVAAEAIRARRRIGRPIPEPLHRLFTRLDLEIRVSSSGHQTHGAAAQSETEQLIGSNEAGQLLGLSRRQTQRLSADLDGRIIAGRWVYSKRTVLDYLEARNGKPHR